jgi:hypothetical protein
MQCCFCWSFWYTIITSIHLSLVSEIPDGIHKCSIFVAIVIIGSCECHLIRKVLCDIPYTVVVDSFNAQGIQRSTMVKCTPFGYRWVTPSVTFFFFPSDFFYQNVMSIEASPPAIQSTCVTSAHHPQINTTDVTSKFSAKKRFGPEKFLSRRTCTMTEYCI